MILEHPSILITDDDASLRETLRGVFEPQGFRTYQACDGQEALDMLMSGEEIHLLLADMHMPRLTGLETIRLVKQMRAGLPCILMSARADESLVREALSAQAFTVLTKPITVRGVLDNVGQALEKSYNWSARWTG
jgi:CheY-like chemotaxis protein